MTDSKNNPAGRDREVVKLKITGRHVVITPALRIYAVRKLKRILRYSFKHVGVDVKLSVEKYRHRAEIILRINGERMLVKEETDEMYQSIDRAVEKIEQRLRKYKEKRTYHNPLKGLRSVSRPASREMALIKRKPSIVSTLSVGDVISRLSSKGPGHMVFLDDEDDRLKLIVRAQNGRFEITELITD